MLKPYRLLFAAMTFCWATLADPSSGFGVSADQAPELLDDGWAVAAPAEAGLDPGALAALTQSIEDGDIENVHAVLIEHAGRLVYEEYFTGHDERWGRPIGIISFDRDDIHDLRSVTKSVTSALLGIALGGDYKRAVDRPIIDYFPDFEGKFGEGVEDVTLYHVLTMTAGIEWNEMEVPYTNRDNDERQLNRAANPVGMVLARDVRDPVGTRWYYNGGLTQVVGGLIQRITGKRLDTFAEETLFGPLGIDRYEWLGSRHWPRDDPPSAASGLRMRARDLAKIGSLFLHRGVWNGQRVIAAEWIDLSTRRYVQNIPWSPSGTFGYGYMWYPGQTRGSEGYRIIRAAGNGDQRIFIVPEKGIVVTVFAGNYNNYGYRSGKNVMVAVLAAMTSGD